VGLGGEVQELIDGEDEEGNRTKDVDVDVDVDFWGA
jgi:hypothetical protein